MTARHVSSTNPERVQAPAAYGRKKDGATTIRTICMVCGHVTIAGLPESPTSHGLCDSAECERLTSEPVDEAMLNHLARRMAFAWGRYVRRCEGWVESREAERLHAAYKRAEARVAVAIDFMGQRVDKVGAPAAKNGGEGAR